MVGRKLPSPELRQTLINDFAIRSFRNVGDQDYIAARLSYRSALYPQFRWSALQVIEKYLKSILLLNRVPAKRVGHDLGMALKLTRRLPFALQLSDASQRFVSYLDNSARFRYLEGSYYVHGPKLVELDRAVWEVRRYCRPLNYDLKRPDGSVQNMLSAEIATIESATTRPRHKFRIMGGRLEKILADPHHPSRPGLVWNNMFFGGKTRDHVRMHIPIYAENAPLWLHPEILNEVLEYVYLPENVAEAYRAELEKRQQEE
jgi:hypothetical protein